MNKYKDIILELINKIFLSQKENMEKASSLIYETICNKNSVYIFGASHAGILSEELFYRAGGLALINPVFAPNLMLNIKPVTFTSDMEKLEGYGKILFKNSSMNKGDTLIIHSVSGRNPVSVEMAEEAVKNDVSVIVITNLKYSKFVSSRHTNGKKLFELGNIVIDNCGDIGDASVKLEGLEQKVAPTSSIAGILILNSIIIDVVENMLEEEKDVPVFFSANLDKGYERNLEIFRKYSDQIHYMK